MPLEAISTDMKESKIHSDFVCSGGELAAVHQPFE